MKKALLFTALALATTGVFAQTTTTPPCPANTVTCNNSTQHMGDTTQTASADNDQSVTQQVGTHANSVASGVTIDPSIQQSGNANSTQSDNHLSNLATGGTAIGNQSSNDNKSSASTGASSANNTGMNGLGGTATTGPVTGTVTSTNENRNNVGQDQKQAATALAQGGAGGAGGSSQTGDIGSTSAAASRLATGDIGSHSSADNSGGNSTTQVDASDRSVHVAKTSLVAMAEQPAVPMSFSPSMFVTATTDGECLPYQRVISTPLYGVYFKLWGRTERVELGYTDTLAQPTIEALSSTWGARAIYAFTSVNVSGARSLSLGGGGSSGGFGQGNVGSSSAMTVLVQHIVMRTCRLAPRVIQQVTIIAPPVQQFTPAPILRKRVRKPVTPYCPPTK